ncbi:MAG: hypothetical protein CMI16_01555 [Opitutaceae bacterium]|nr:hypothetical protein [Opitutaceae bacterium]
MQYLRSILCVCLIATSALAQNVKWQSAGTGDSADLQLVYEDCKPTADPQLPAISGARLTFRGRSEQTSVINFSVSRTVIYSYRLQIGKATAVSIPSFKVSTDKGELTVPAYNTATVQPGPEADIRASLNTNRPSVWAGEVFPLTYGFDVARRSFSNFGGEINWDSAPLITEEWGKYQAGETKRDGETRLLVAFRNRAYAPTAGSYQLNPVNQLLNLSLGTVGFRLFQQQRVEQITISTDPVALEVRPLPTAPAGGFSGAVGEFKLTSKVVPEKAAVGEPITWTLELSGQGNWPEIAGLPARSVSRDFQVITPEAKQTPEEGKLFDASLFEDVVLVPTKPGTYTLGAVEFTYFDPKSGSYKTARTPAKSITVDAVSASALGNVTAPPASTDAPVDPASPITAPEAPTDPQGIPRDPISGSDEVCTPFASTSQLIGYASLPFAAVLLTWLLLSARRAAQTDPRKPQRAAKQRLSQTLSKLDHASDSERELLLISWQHDTAKLWSLDHAAPAAEALNDPEWTTVWIEAEQALYSSKRDLPSDWSARAKAALTAKKVSDTAWLRTFLPRNLLPLLAIMLSVALSPNTQAEPSEDYRQGEFKNAAKAWQSTVDANPTDWIARHNLSLALAQQERWGEAAAQATAAFVQNPSDDANRWNLALAYQNAGYTPTAIAPLLESQPLADLAQLASPAKWEWLIIVSAIGIVVALIVLLLVGYNLAPRWVKWVALLIILIDAILIGAAVSGRSAYGIAADPQVALVWQDSTLFSIPTEVESTQQTTALSAGSMGTMDNTFLGWTRLTFPNGQTGWVRKDDLVKIWK